MSFIPKQDAEKKPLVWVVTTSLDGDNNCRKGIAAALSDDNYLEIKVDEKCDQRTDEILNSNFPTKHPDEIKWPDVIIGRERDAQFMNSVRQLSRKDIFRITVLDPTMNYTADNPIGMAILYAMRETINSSELTVGFEHQNITIPGLRKPIFLCKTVPSLVTRAH